MANVNALESWDKNSCGIVLCWGWFAITHEINALKNPKIIFDTPAVP